MSLEITYLSDDKKYKWRLSVNEVEAIDILASKGFKDRVDAVLGVVGFGKKTFIAQSRLFDAVVFLINELENNPDLTPYFFDVEVEIPRGSGNYSTGGTAISGLKINGGLYDIEHGLDKCLKIKKWQDENMKVHQGEPVDIRHLSIIETDDDSIFGDVKIIKRKMSNVLVKNLKKLKAFLEKCTGVDIIKVLG